MSPGLDCAPHGNAVSRSIARGEAIERGGLEQLLRIDRHERGIGDMAVAHPERLLGRFHAQVHVIGAVGSDALQPQALEDAEDHQRYGALRRRRHVVERAQAMRQLDGCAQLGGVTVEVGEHERAAEFGEVARDRARELAFVKIGEPVLRKLAQRRRNRRLAHQRTRRRRFAIDEKARAESRHVFQFGELSLRVRRLAARNDDAAFGVMHRVLEQARERHAAAPVLRAVVERQRPARDRAGDGVGGERPARRNRREVLAAIKIDRRAARGAAAGVDA